MPRFRFTVPKTHSLHLLFLGLAVVTVFTVAGCKKSEQATAVSGPKTFASPDEASSAVYTAAKSGDGQALIAIFGPDATDLIVSGDPVQDKEGRDKFAAQYDEMHRWGKLTNGGKVLTVGAENYPFPFSLMKNSSGQWYFDSRSAKEEILARRIGGNELATVDVLNAMSDAQIEYFSQTHDGSSVYQFAQKFVSDDGKQNGLYWAAAEGQTQSPLDAVRDFAKAVGYTNAGNNPQPFEGYNFRILTKQGDKAPGGAKDYLVDGKMTGGFAVLAYPTGYRNSGIMTFIVGPDGIVYQKDLGEKTSEVAAAMVEYNPGDGWNPAI